MKSAILIHGWGSKEGFYNPERPTESNSHWFPWLSKQLMIRDIHTVSLEMPNSHYPIYEIWKKELERFDIDEDTILVGHSCGGGFIVRWLSENTKCVGKVVLVAPWLGQEPDRDFDEKFFDFKLDPDFVSRTKGVTVMNSTDDNDVIQQTVNVLMNEVSGCKHIEFTDKGHFTLNDLGTVEFPELLEELLK
jgi:predicted alpha/beta hydrolase family esterase